MAFGTGFWFPSGYFVHFARLREVVTHVYSKASGERVPSTLLHKILFVALPLHDLLGIIFALIAKYTNIS